MATEATPEETALKVDHAPAPAALAAEPIEADADGWPPGQRPVFDDVEEVVGDDG